MENIIKDIQRVLHAFHHINLELDSRKSIVEIDFDDLNIWFYNELQQIEQHLQLIYFYGNDLMLDRIKEELLKIEDMLKKQFNCGIRISIENKEFIFEIHPEILNKNRNIKLIYVQQLVVFINKLRINQAETQKKIEQGTIEMKPVLKPEAVQIVFDIIKDFFNSEQQAELKRVIQTGNRASNKLLFKSNGNRLTDTFKKLIEHDYITGCQKQDLINWIILNFTYSQQYKVKEFIYDTVEKTISRNDNPCKSPLIEIFKGQILKVDKSRTKNYNKH
jgi:hypothetical protein